MGRIAAPKKLPRFVRVEVSPQDAAREIGESLRADDGAADHSVVADRHDGLAVFVKCRRPCGSWTASDIGAGIENSSRKKSSSMLAYDGLGPDDGYGIKDARATAIKPRGRPNANAIHGVAHAAEER